MKFFVFQGFIIPSLSCNFQPTNCLLYVLVFLTLANTTMILSSLSDTPFNFWRGLTLVSRRLVYPRSSLLACQYPLLSILSSKRNHLSSLLISVFRYTSAWITEEVLAKSITLAYGYPDAVNSVTLEFGT